MCAQNNAGFLPIQNIADFKCRLNTCVKILSPELATPQNVATADVKGRTG